jgi:hypothetical protein
MGRWVLVGVSVLGFATAFGTRSPGLLAVGLLVGLGALVGAALAFAAARIEGSTQGQSSREIAMILEARKHKAALDARNATPASAGDAGGPRPAAAKHPVKDDATDGGD